jgi:hypothetical protein
MGGGGDSPFMLFTASLNLSQKTPGFGGCPVHSRLSHTFFLAKFGYKYAFHKFM